VGGGGDDLSLREARLPADQRFERPTLLTAADSHADTGGPTAALAPLFERLRACSIAAVPFGRAGTILLVERRADRRFEPDDWDLLRTVARQAESAVQRVELFREVRDLSLTDPLTGLANRRQLGVVLDRGIAAARRGEPLTLAMVDLDDFKGVNDRFGHAVGDRVLRAAADALQAEARGSDLVARYGGDEFVVVLPGGRAASAETLLRRVEARLRGEIGLSAGVAEYAPGIATADELIAAADRELYHAKQRAGRKLLRAE
jgi:diguanylate cyclase (GGDEF)-like protein